MKPKTMILMVVAIACGLAASYMTSQLLAERNNKPSEAEPEKVMVLVAKNNLPTGLLIKEPKEHFKEKAFLKGEEPQKALTAKDYDSLRDRRLIKPLSTDQFVSAEDLLDKNANSMAVRLPEGMRAVGIKVNIQDIAGGFASLPMSHVDIISVLRRGSDGDSLSQILLENVLVLGADQEMGRKEGQNAMVASTVTLALSPEDAEVIALAQEMGTLKLVLRGFNDNKPSKTNGVSGDAIARRGRAQDRLRGSKVSAGAALDRGSILRKVVDVKDPEAKEPEKVKATPPVVVAKPKPKNKIHILTVYNGDQGRRYPYRLDPNGKVVQEDITEADPEPKKPAPVVEKPKPPVVAQPAVPVLPPDPPPARRGRNR